MSQLPSLGFKSEMYFTQTVNSFGGHCVLIDKMIKAQVSEDVCATPLHHGFLQFKVLIWTRVCTNIFHKVPIFSNNHEYDANMTICASSSRGQRVWMLCASHWIQWMGISGPRMALHDTSRRSLQICHTGHNGPPNSLQAYVSNESDIRHLQYVNSERDHKRLWLIWEKSNATVALWVSVSTFEKGSTCDRCRQRESCWAADSKVISIFQPAVERKDFPTSPAVEREIFQPL